MNDLPLNTIPGLIKKPGQIISGAGNQVLDLNEDPGLMVSASDNIILGCVQRPPPITRGPVTLTYAVERYYMDVRDGFRINSRGRLYAEGAHTRFLQLHNWLKKHAASSGEIDLFNVTDAWLKDFVRYLHHQPIALNTVSGLIDNVHAIINAMISDGLPLRRLTVRVLPEVADAVFNPEEELEILLNTEYSHEAISLVRDVFVMQSYLGFRVGTLERFLHDPSLYLFDKKQKWYIRIRTNKTGAFVVVPVKNIVLDILKRRNYDFAAVYYEKYYNPLIKLMARDAGLDDLVPYSMTISGRCKEFIEPKFQLMSSHTARRNFATNAYLAGIGVDSIMWITGHRTREAFFRYIRADSLANAIAVSGHKFFQ